MKKLIYALNILLLLCLSLHASAVPAKPGKRLVLQPNGSTITIEKHGDEFYHWTTDANGTVVAKGDDGFYHPAQMPQGERLGGRERAAVQAAAIRAARQLRSSGMSTRATAKTYHFPVFLVEFAEDRKFVEEDPQDAFYRLMNEEGYSDNGAVGSVHDYYWENSMETFNAVFDVYGPYSYNGSYNGGSSYYSGGEYDNEDYAAVILWDAIKAYDDTVDFSQYDNDGDGTVDMVFLYYAGYNEAEGDDDAIWPHKYNFSYAGVTTSSLDGKKFDTYACTSELQGTSGSVMCGIGTAAHEFSHTQGLPDFYDVTYNNYGDGLAGGTYSYDIMCSGSYNNNGRTPPYFNAMERKMMGWLDDFTELPSSGSITLPSVDLNFAYKIATSTTSGNGEYFILESRKGTGWDAYLAPGMVVYHVDQSKATNVTFKISSSGSYSFTPYDLWNSYSSYINASGDHPCFTIVPAVDQDNLNIGNYDKIPFPGSHRVSTYRYSGWYGETPSDMLSNITFNSSDGTVTFIREDAYLGVSGFVKNTSGEGIPGAVVNVYETYKGRAISEVTTKMTGGVVGSIVASATTDEEGYYYIPLKNFSGSNVTLEAEADGYITEGLSVNFGTENLTFSINDLTLRGVSEPLRYTMRKFGDLEGSLYLLGTGTAQSVMAGAMFTSEDLRPYVGRQILRLGFVYDSETVDAAYGVVDFGSTRKAWVQVEDPDDTRWNYVDLSDLNLTIPEDESVYIGYALKNPSSGYPWVYESDEPKDGGFCYASYNETSSSWNSASGYGNILVYAVLSNEPAISFNYIENPKYGNYSVGDTLELNLIEVQGDRKPNSTIEWFYDDEPVAGSVTFSTAGSHLIEAKFTTVAGLRKVVDLNVQVK